MEKKYFGCMGCGREFALTDDEIAQYGLHDCDQPDVWIVVPHYNRISLIARIRRYFRI